MFCESIKKNPNLPFFPDFEIFGHFLTPDKKIRKNGKIQIFLVDSENLGDFKIKTENRMNKR